MNFLRLAILAILCSALAYSQIPSTMQKSLFYEDNIFFRGFNQPVVDHDGNLIVIATQFGFDCPFNQCGVIVYSIAPNGKLNWKKPDMGFAAPAANQVVVSPDNTIYFQGHAGLGQIFGYSPMGIPITGWPVNIGFPLVTGRKGLLIDPIDASIIAKGGTSFSFGTFPGVVAAYHPDSSPKWQANLLNAPNNGPGMVIGPNDDVYTYDNHGVILSHTDGHEICQFGQKYAPLAGGSDGVFTQDGANIVKMNPDCSVTSIFTSPQGMIEIQGYDNGIIFATDHPSPLTSLSQFRFLAIKTDGTLLWPQGTSSSPFVLSNLATVSNGRLYALGQDLLDGRQKLFIVDEVQGSLIDVFDTTGTCAQCGVATGIDGAVYLNDLGSLTIFLLTQIGAPTLTGVTPSAAPQGSLTNIAIKGGGFDSNSTISLSGDGILFVGSPTISSFEIDAVIAIAEDALVSSRNLTVSTANGASVTLKSAFRVLPGNFPPNITASFPQKSSRGQDVLLTINGTHFHLPTVNLSRQELTIRKLTSTTTQIQATVHIPADAQTGSVDVSVTNIDGQTFTLASALNITKRTVIIIPGIMGTNLKRVDNGDVLWIDRSELLTEHCNESLLPLTLSDDGLTPATSVRIRCDDGNQFTSAGVALSPDTLLTQAFINKYGLLEDSLTDYNVVPFPYDWRLHYSLPANQLRTVIAELTQDTPQDTVDIIAHSQGGLIFRTLMAEHPPQPVRTVIYLGTPHSGAVKSYAILRGWSSFEHYYGSAIPHLNFGTATMLSQTFPAVYELLPRFSFRSVDGIFEKPEISFLDVANQTFVSEAEKLWARLSANSTSVSSFAINGTNRNTLRAILEDTSTGCMTPFDDPTGDGTVPSISSGALPSTQYFYVEQEHADLAADIVVINMVQSLLNSGGVDPSGGWFPTPFGNDSISASTCSPVKMKITDKQGRSDEFSSDGSLASNIPNSDFFALGHGEGALLPFGSDFDVHLKATDDGTFSLRFNHNDASGSVIDSVQFQDVPIARTSTISLQVSGRMQTSPLMVDLDGDGVPDFAVEGNTEMSSRAYLQALVVIIKGFRVKKDTSEDLIEILRKAEEEFDRGKFGDLNNRLLKFMDKVSKAIGKSVSAQQADILLRLAGLAMGRIVLNK